MTEPAAPADANRKRIRRTAWILGACAVAVYVLFLYSGLRA